MSPTPWSAGSTQGSASGHGVPSDQGSLAGASSSSTPAFSSSWGAFNLSQPRHTQPSNLTMQLESHPIDQAHLSAFPRRTVPANASLGGGGVGSGLGASISALAGGGTGLGTSFGASTRRQSTLGMDSAMLDEDEDDDDNDGTGTRGLLSRSAREPLSRRSSGGVGREDVSMSTFDPALPASGVAMSARSARSRSASESMPHHSLPPPPTLFQNVPPSPVTVARALQAGQKTPPAMFQRRLFKDDHMLDDGSNSEARSSRSGSSSDVGSLSARDVKGKKKATLSDMLQDDEEIEELSAGLSRSTSGEETEARVVRRPLSRRPNLLPKTKSHLRVLSDLRSESAPADLSEIASEATLHRLSKSGASTVPPIRPQSVPGSTAARFEHGRPPNTTFSLGQVASNRPTPNRFPETADEDDSLLAANLSESSSSDDQDGMDDLAGLEVGSDWGGMSTNGYETGPEDEEGKKMQMVWNGIRSGGGSRATHAAMLGKSPGSGGSRGMEVENPFNVPQTPISSFSSRPGKRKINDDRFEPYSHALKRRAVSPAASSLSLSPGFGATASTSAIPIAPLSSTTTPVSIPSPTLSASASHHQSFFSSIHQPLHMTTAGQTLGAASGTRSIVGSPVASSLSSSAGRTSGFGFPGFSLGLSDRYRTPGAAGSQQAAGDDDRVKMDDGIGRMSLGEGQKDPEEEEL
ncbi:hypothetical protein JCM10212_006590 [Sporobolomyces blumeae]